MKPKHIVTELGTERLCIHCDEYFPLDTKFWVSKLVTLKSGIIKRRFYSACKGCYQERYKCAEKRALKSKSKVKIMNDNKIYSFKANGNGARVSGRVCASNMRDASAQVVEIIKGYGQMNVNVAELKNQAAAMKQWEARQAAKAQKASAKVQELAQ